MINRSYAVLLAALTLAVLANTQAPECPLIVLPDELGNATAPSTEGLVASAYVGGDSAGLPLVQILDYRRVCLAAGKSPDRYRGVSVIVRYNCDGTGSLTIPAPCRPNVTAQFEFQCIDSDGDGGDPPQWVAFSTIVRNIVTFPADGDFGTPLRISCAVCVNPVEGGLEGLGLDVEVESHCVGE